MQGSITLNELGIFIFFVLVVVAIGYAILALRNINGLVKEVTTVLQSNRDHFNQIIPNVNKVSENTARISEELMLSVGEAGDAIKTISHGTADTVLTINQTADQLAKYALMVGEVVKIIINMFSSSDKDLK